ncbi:MAG: DUF2911 domain-containing protein [Microscillaceae bacterium]|jgi:tetratricopeptide (TPR) repeat protein|nr:DUF2911 domain-containing protein [Microscillaceae bacterium]
MLSKTYHFLRICLFVALVVASVERSTAQQVTLPDPSPRATLSQKIGLTTISIAYNRPMVRNRKIWGDLIPYNRVWRAGANENTVISFSTDVKIEGKVLKAGSYGFHTIPNENEWTLIFSSNYTSWGSEFYKPEEDVLRVSVKPQTADHQEALQYDMNDVTSNSTLISLRWEKLRVPFKVEIDLNETILASIRRELRSIQGFSWDGYYSAAAYCLLNNINLAEAMTWIDQSIQIEENFSNLSVKSQLLAKAGKTAEADAMMKKALPLGKVLEVHGYARQLITQKRPKEALEIFQMNAKKYPNQWPVNWGLARAYSANGNFKEALKYAKIALPQAPDELNKSNIERAIKTLEASKDIN